MSVVSYIEFSSPRPDLREGKLGSCPGPPQLWGASTKNSKKYYLRKHKNISSKLIIRNKKMMSHYSFNSLKMHVSILS